MVYSRSYKDAFMVLVASKNILKIVISVEKSGCKTLIKHCTSLHVCVYTAIEYIITMAISLALYILDFTL